MRHEPREFRPSGQCWFFNNYEFTILIFPEIQIHFRRTLVQASDASKKKMVGWCRGCTTIDPCHRPVGYYQSTMNKKGEMHLPIFCITKNARHSNAVAAGRPFVLHLCVPTINDLIYSHIRIIPIFDLMRETIYAEPRC